MKTFAIAAALTCFSLSGSVLADEDDWREFSVIYADVFPSESTVAQDTAQTMDAEAMIQSQPTAAGRQVEDSYITFVPGYDPNEN